MSLTTSEMTPADIAAVTNHNCNNGGFGGFGNDGWWIILLFLFAGGRGFGGWSGGNGGVGAPCATQADVRSAVDQQTLISKIDAQTYGLADSFTALNNTLNNNFRSLDGSVCSIGYQIAQVANNISAQIASCCCDTRSAIKDVGIGIEKTGWELSKQISDCCCGIEKANMQSRFDAQAYNCNTLQAIDKLGDRIIDYMAAERTQALRDENQALRLAASQARQNQYLVNELRPPVPIPAYITCNPYAAAYGNAYGGCYGGVA